MGGVSLLSSCCVTDACDGVGGVYYDGDDGDGAVCGDGDAVCNDDDDGNAVCDDSDAVYDDGDAVCD